MPIELKEVVHVGLRWIEPCAPFAMVWPAGMKGRGIGGGVYIYLGVTAALLMLWSTGMKGLGRLLAHTTCVSYGCCCVLVIFVWI